MPVLFISHSSKDDAAAIALETWLRARGFTDLFIDHRSILGGEKRAQALRDAAGACRIVICLVTNHWLASDECFGEFKAAWYMGNPSRHFVAIEPLDDNKTLQLTFEPNIDWHALSLREHTYVWNSIWFQN
jgi:hypothetical protein